MIPQRAEAAHTKMSYIEYMNQLHEVDRAEPLDPAAGWLYVKLIGFFNDRRWPASAQFADPFLCMASGIKSANTLKKHRAELERRGLIQFAGGLHGSGKKGEYRLLMVGSEKPSEKPSLIVSKFDSFSDGFGGDDSGKPSIKPSGKVSNFDTNTKREDREDDVTTEGRRGIEKKIGEHVFSTAQPDGPAASAPHTGGAPALALQPGEMLRGGFIDQQLPDADPRKWEARPKDAAMVDEYLAGHADPEVSKHAGKGSLFFDYYDGFLWCAGKDGKPIRNWRAVARQFSFVDYKAQREAQAAAAGGSQIEQRSSTVSSARAMLHAKRAGNNG